MFMKEKEKFALSVWLEDTTDGKHSIVVKERPVFRRA